MITEILSAALWSKVGKLLVIVVIFLLIALAGQKALLIHKDNEILELTKLNQQCREDIEVLSIIERSLQKQFSNEYGEKVRDLCKEILRRDMITEEEIDKVLNEKRRR